MLSTVLKSIFLASVFFEGSCTQLRNMQMNHKGSKLSENSIKYLAGLSDTNNINEILDNILIQRVVGTPGHQKVFDYITKELKDLNWTVDIDEFTDATPKGPLKFKNIIATLNPNAERYLVLACHYDSKYFENIVFVGAIDSAVPCAMMLNLIKVMDKELKSIQSNDLNLKLIFFDGEEAFEEWGPHDSIYGAKHLAQTYHNSKTKSLISGEDISEIEKIDLFVLLDLIGHKETQFISIFTDTENWYLRLADIEGKLENMRLFGYPRKRYFRKRRGGYNIEDDHIPFLRRNVPILHLISIPFGNIWHTANDNRTAVDMTTVENINKILRIFVAEYLNMLVSKS